MTTLTLPAQLDTVSAKPLLLLLRDVRGVDLNIDASGVVRFGAQALQVLLAARKCWQSEGRLFRIWNPSDDLRASLQIMGATEFIEEESLA